MLVIQQVKSHNTSQVENNEEKNIGSFVISKDRSKQKVNDIQIKEPTKVDKAQMAMSNSDIELERREKIGKKWKRNLR